MAKKRNFKRVVLIADMHCGHRTGLTPPKWQLHPDEENPQRMKWVVLQQEAWDWYSRTMARLRPIDVLIVNGDCIDGTGWRSGGTELITTDRQNQIDMAIACIKKPKAPKICIVRGTPYHTGEQEDMENLIASYFKERPEVEQCKIGDHEWYDVNGVIFDVKHAVGGSQIPHGRQTAISREALWNAIWAEASEQPRGDWIIRSHVHYSVGNYRWYGPRQVWAIISPALQAMGTRYGARSCSGTVDFGLMYWDIMDDGSVKQWEVLKADLVAQKALALKL